MTKSEYATELYHEPQPCSVCNGSAADMLGTLGKTIWMRCRDCGLDFKLEDQE
jgi:hypothetical protein